ncbi:MAG: Crp/Fnr family transcriptional regulator [Brumimicrobium sp.]
MSLSTSNFYKFTLFESLSPDVIEKIEQNHKLQTFKNNQPLFLEGVYPTGVFCIHSGKVKVFSLGETGKEQIIRIASEGDVVGFRAIFSEEPFKLSATAIEKCEISFLKLDFFNELVHSNPLLMQSILKEISKEVGERAVAIKTMAQKSVKERLAVILLVLEDIYKEDMINLTREDLANFVGTATETTIRLLKDFKDKGYIEIHGRKIKIIDSNGIYRETGY